MTVARSTQGICSSCSRRSRKGTLEQVARPHLHRRRSATATATGVCCLQAQWTRTMQCESANRGAETARRCRWPQLARPGRQRCRVRRQCDHCGFVESDRAVHADRGLGCVAQRYRLDRSCRYNRTHLGIRAGCATVRRWRGGSLRCAEPPASSPAGPAAPVPSFVPDLSACLSRAAGNRLLPIVAATPPRSERRYHRRYRQSAVLRTAT